MMVYVKIICIMQCVLRYRYISSHKKLFSWQGSHSWYLYAACYCIRALFAFSILIILCRIFNISTIYIECLNRCCLKISAEQIAFVVFSRQDGLLSILGFIYDTIKWGARNIFVGWKCELHFIVKKDEIQLDDMKTGKESLLVLIYRTENKNRRITTLFPI